MQSEAGILWTREEMNVGIGIQVQHSIPYTPQQNGVAERKNRSLKEMTTCMLESKKLAENLWDEAMHDAEYI